jgi:two-component system, OmpR family, response regulator VicR
MKKMLIIEDDQLVGNIYRHKFQVEGFEVEVAGDGEAGIKAVSSFQPDVVILDLMLPKLNGVEVLRKIRSNAQSQSLPVVVLSNAYLSNLVQEAWKAGANNCLIKASCTPKQLIEVVHKTLGDAPARPPAAPNEAAKPGAAAQAAAALAVTPVMSSPEDDTAFQTELRQAFLKNGPDSISQLRALLQTFIKSEGDSVRLPNLFMLYRRVHSVTSNSAVAGLTVISKMSSALEALIKELYEKPKNINASTIRTLAQTIDLLGQLLDHSSSLDLENMPPPNILVVDDEAISRRAVIYALEKAHLKCVSVDDPEPALKMLAENRFDLIFLDVDMPGMSGFDLCTKLRTFPTNTKAPVVFVTGLTDFESRARSTLSGGSDLIAKPFLFMELAVKALSLVLRGQLNLPRT